MSTRKMLCIVTLSIAAVALALSGNLVVSVALNGVAVTLLLG